jgi:hypothetical protein
MPLSLEARRAVLRETQERYRKSSKKEKGQLLEQFCTLTGYQRTYASRLLHRKLQGSRSAAARKKRKRPLYYGPEVAEPLRKIWAVMDGICGKRLAPFLPEILHKLESCGELQLDPQVREKLLAISASTIDRLLGPSRKELHWKGKTHTKPGSLLKHQIPVRTFAEWDPQSPGFLEVDLVDHDGGIARGDYVHTLDLTDVASGWTETIAVPNKAQLHVFAALKEVRCARLPFPVLGLDTDNGSEFINHELYRYCLEEKITFTRARPGRKNDTCYVEQKNYSVVRRMVGYARYDTPEELAVLNRLYIVLRFYTNFFQPTMKLVGKERRGSRVTKHYGKAQTPVQRLLAFPDTLIHQKTKDEIRLEYEVLNPAELMHQIRSLQEELAHLATIKETMRRSDTKNGKWREANCKN